MRSGKRSQSGVLPSMSVNKKVRSSIVTHVHYTHRQDCLETLLKNVEAAY